MDRTNEILSDSPAETQARLSEYASHLAVSPVFPYEPRCVNPAVALPWNPSAGVQQKFVGATFDAAYQEAARFVGQAFEWSTSQAVAGAHDTRVLDFGSGWGRITRLLLSRYEPTELYCLDVDSEMTALIQSTLPGVNAITGNPFPPSVLADASMSLGFAFSVFSHLAETAHASWAREFGRITSPGGLVFITVLDQMFFDQVANCQEAVRNGSADPFTLSLAGLLEDVPTSRDHFASGGFIYGDPGSDGPRTGDFYGWAAAPQAWMETHWGAAGFDILHWIPSGILFKQAMVCLKRR